MEENKKKKGGEKKGLKILGLVGLVVLALLGYLYYSLVVNYRKSDDYQGLALAYDQDNYTILKEKIEGEDGSVLDDKTLKKVKAYKALDDYGLNDDEGQVYLTNRGSFFKTDYGLRVKPLSLKLKTNQKDSQVYLDGEKVGQVGEDKTFYLEELSYGDHELRLVYESSYGPIVKEASLELYDFDKEDFEEVLDLDLNYLTIGADDPKAQLYMDGKKTGQDFSKGEIKIGPYPKDSPVELAAVVEGREDEAAVVSLSSLKDKEVLQTSQSTSLGMDGPFIANINESEKISLIKGDKFLEDQSMDGYVRQWMESGVKTAVGLTEKDKAYYLTDEKIVFLDDNVENIKISDQGNMVAYIKEDKLYTYSPKTGKKDLYSSKDAMVWDFNISPNGKNIVYSSMDQGYIMVNKDKKIPTSGNYAVLSVDDDVENIVLGAKIYEDDSYMTLIQASKDGNTEFLGQVASFIVLSQDRKHVVFDFKNEMEGKNGLVDYNLTEGRSEILMDHLGPDQGIDRLDEGLRHASWTPAGEDRPHISIAIHEPEKFDKLYLRTEEPIDMESIFSFYAYKDKKIEKIADFSHTYMRSPDYNYRIDEKNDYFYYASGEEAARVKMKAGVKEVLEKDASKIVPIGDHYYYLDKEGRLYRVDGKDDKKLIDKSVRNFVVNSKDVVGTMKFDMLADQRMGNFYYDGQVEKASSINGNIILRNDNVIYYEFGPLSGDFDKEPIMYVMNRPGKMVKIPRASLMLTGIFMEIPMEY